MLLVPRFFISVAIVVFGLAVATQLSGSSTIYADTKSAIDGGIKEANGGVTPAPEATKNNLIRQIVNVFSIIVGAVAVIMIIYGGFRYVTSGGDSNSVSSAKRTITYAAIGLIVVVLAQVIARYAIGVGNNAISGSSTNSQSSGSTPCRPLPNGNCAPGTGP